MVFFFSIMVLVLAEIRIFLPSVALAVSLDSFSSGLQPSVFACTCHLHLGLALFLMPFVRFFKGP